MPFELLRSAVTDRVSSTGRTDNDLGLEQNQQIQANSVSLFAAESLLGTFYHRAIFRQCGGSSK